MKTETGHMDVLNARVRDLLFSEIKYRYPKTHRIRRGKILRIKVPNHMDVINTKGVIDHISWSDIKEWL